MKTKQITYTTEKLDRNFSKPTFESMAKIVWQRITNSMFVDVFRFAIEFNRNRQAMKIANHFANPNQERDMQMWLNELKFGKL
jgi:hypothetical protein